VCLSNLKGERWEQEGEQQIGWRKRLVAATQRADKGYWGPGGPMGGRGPDLVTGGGRGKGIPLRPGLVPGHRGDTRSSYISLPSRPWCCKNIFFKSFEVETSPLGVIEK